MAHIASGSFFGYREVARPLKKYRRAVGLKAKPWSFGPSFFHFAMMGPIPYGYKSYDGRAGDSFPADLTLFPFFARVLQIKVTRATAEIIISYDGSTLGDIMEYDGPSVHIQGARGFMIRNKVPGLPAKYQIIALR